MPQKRKRNANMPLDEQVATRRTKRARNDQEQNVDNISRNEQEQNEVNMVRDDQEQTVTDAVPLDRLADIMLGKMVAKGLIFT